MRRLLRGSTGWQSTARSLHASRLLIASVCLLASCTTQQRPPTTTPVVPSASAPPSASVSAVETVNEIVRTYVAALASRDFPTAWQLLADETKAQFGSFEQYVSDRTAFLESARNVTTIGLPSNKAADLNDWWFAVSEANLDRNHAYVVMLEYPALAGTNSDWSMLMVAPNGAGNWRVWIVR
jgi:hypothetical protein